eukprot:CAMPEP_0194482658 /NCGR_PEP_ID=MMETSP0253-20130528/4506_1 /TAXON_ID=2966 /ORGANISM="Noctiluca scintillans" /LENGTH=71 /DNA_ID=CAMNT_0039322209 /DNA_START=59 /DNA_END=274 /DNA_ORIENTATION=+
MTDDTRRVVLHDIDWPELPEFDQDYDPDEDEQDVSLWQEDWDDTQWEDKDDAVEHFEERLKMALEQMESEI